MADRVSTLLAAIASTLQATGRFQRIYTYDAVALDPLPCVTMWWQGFGRLDAEPRGDVLPRITRHRVLLRVCTRFDPARQQADEEALRALVEATVQALDANQRLGGAAVRSLVQQGDVGEVTDGRRRALFADLLLAVDVANW